MGIFSFITVFKRKYEEYIDRRKKLIEAYDIAQYN